jgi:hypothetical protein
MRDSWRKSFLRSMATSSMMTKKANSRIGSKK